MPARLSSAFLSDGVAFLNDGLPMSTLAAAGTHSGSAMIWGGRPPSPWRKLGLLFQCGAGGNVSLFLQTATASNGAFATFTSPNQTASAATMTPTAPKNFLYVEARGEMIEDLATQGYWIQVVVVQTGAVTGGALAALGLMPGDQPATSEAGVGLTTFFLM